MAQVPALSSTGGSISIIPSNGYTRGISWPGPSGVEQGPRYNFATVTGCGLLRCAGQRAYILSQDWNGSGATQTALNTLFTSSSIQDIQGSMHPRFDYAGSVGTWHALSLPTLLITRLAKFYLQPNLPSPDYGRSINCGAHRGSYGNLLMCQSFSQSPSITRTIDLTSIAVSGQKTIKYCAVWQSITITLLNVGATSDIQTFTPDGCSFVAYAGANNQAAEYSPAVISVRLADIATAAKVVVEYNYLPYPFTNPTLQSMMLPQTFDCGTGSACVLPVDRQIGTVWYKVIYLGSSGQVLATSGLQTF
jgi:membrane-bound inhibitor of C-type lysozyme